MSLIFTLKGLVFVSRLIARLIIVSRLIKKWIQRTIYGMRKCGWWRSSSLKCFFCDESVVVPWIVLIPPFRGDIIHEAFFSKILEIAV
jgi:hypothetical protein